MRRFVGLIGVIAMLFAATAVASLAAPPPTAVVSFGDDTVGSGLNNPPEGVFHDSSWKANDKVRPRTVVISTGGSVEFDVEGFHQVAVCSEGVDVRDVEVPDFPPNIFVDDAQCPVAAAPAASTMVAFAEPGRYLVICNVTPHFRDARMYTYVDVK